MRIPARCNKRTCQARRNLSKWPEEYKRGWPKCHYAGCGGKMYVDKYRLRKGPKDRAPLCLEDCYSYPHRYDSLQCKYSEDYSIDRALARSKHSPMKPVPAGEPVPF